MAREPDGLVFVHEYVTGGGLAGRPLPKSWAAQGSAMRRAVAADFAAQLAVEVVMTLDDRLEDEDEEEKNWRTVRVGPGRELEVFSELAAQAKHTLLIAPESGGILLDRARLIKQVKGRSLGCTIPAIAAAGDKLKMEKKLNAAGVPTVKSRKVSPRDGLPRDFPYPAVLKPIDGAGTEHTFYLESADELPDESLALPEAILQPFAPGIPMSASFLATPESTLLVGLARQWITRPEGRFVYSGGTLFMDDAFPTEVLHKAACALPGLRGWVGVDFLWEEETKRITVLEVNPRLTTSYVGARWLYPGGWLAHTWLWANYLGTFRPYGKRATARATRPGYVGFNSDGFLYFDSSN